MRERARVADREGPICYIDAFLRENMPENFVYVRILQMIADPRLRGDDEERARMTRKAFVMFA